jgi:hypothetical protein
MAASKEQAAVWQELKRDARRLERRIRAAGNDYEDGDEGDIREAIQNAMGTYCALVTIAEEVEEAADATAAVA